MAYALLSRWGPDGFLTHCADIADFYRARRDAFERVARKHLTGLAEWTTPVAGMFIYMKVLRSPITRIVLIYFDCCAAPGAPRQA